MQIAGAIFAIIGALDAFPRRLAIREIAARHGTLRRGLSRRTNVLVIGHRAIDTWTPDRILSRLDEAKAAGAQPISENSFLSLLDLRRDSDATRQLSRQDIIDQSGLEGETLHLFTLFDAFDVSEPPFGFRDLVVAKQFARLLEDGAAWSTVVRAVRSAALNSSEAGIAGLRLERSAWNAVVARHGNEITELDGQKIFPLGQANDESVDALFDEAEEAEVHQDWDRAAALYRRCLTKDSHDPIIPFNLSHVLIEKDELKEARYYLNRVLKLDPAYAEAWYNLAAVARKEKNTASARRYLEKAITADPTYPDPVYNLAHLEFESGDYAEASDLWTRYLELDPDSEWGRKAQRGLQLISMMAKPLTPSVL